MRRKFQKVCEHCSMPFLAYRQRARYCGNKCSVRANPKPQNSPKYRIDLELLKEAEKNTPNGQSRLRYVALKVGCSESLVSYVARRLGFEWESRPRNKLFGRTTHVEHRYVRSVGCVICKETRIVEAAHLIPRTEGGSGMIGNIIPLCPTHHRLYDRGRLSELENDALVDFLYIKYPDLKEQLAHG